MSAALYNITKVIEHRQHILPFLLNKYVLVDGILEHSIDKNIFIQCNYLHQIVEITDLLKNMHAADVADLLVILFQDAQWSVWQLIDNARRGCVLVEVMDLVLANLTKDISAQDLLDAINILNISTQAYLAIYLANHLMKKLLIFWNQSNVFGYAE